MKYKELLILLPCHSLEDFPTYHEGEAADGLLANWTALWHPALIAAAAAKPSWSRVDSPPADLSERLLVVPSVSIQQLPTGFAQRAKSENAVLIRKLSRREDILTAALGPLDDGQVPIDAETVADFLALGYCFLQIQLLTRQMRYSSNLDEVHFDSLVIEGAQAAVAGDVVVARERLTACFHLLAQERDHYYQVDAYVLDIALVAPTTVGAALRTELQTRESLNLLLSAETLEIMSEKEPDTLAALQTALARGNVGLIGGEFTERRLALLSRESLLAELQRGQQQYDRLLGRHPVVFGRRRFGLTPALPPVLSKLGFEGALHATLDDGVFPQGSQIKIRWEGMDGTALDAIAKPPLDASKPQTFLTWAIKLGESMDSDHVATICIAHWPSQDSVWLSDLRRIAKYTPALGKFVTVESYFRDTQVPGFNDRFEASQYRSPYLKQSIIRRHEDPLSTSVRYWQRRAIVEACAATETMSASVGFRSAKAPDFHGAKGDDDLAKHVDQLAEDARATEIDHQLAAALTQAAQQFADTIPSSSTAAQPGYLVLNPLNFTRRVSLVLPELKQAPAVGSPVFAAETTSAGSQVIVDLPPLGYAWLTSGPAVAKPKKPPPPMAEDNLLRNEFFEVVINPVTGSLKSIHEYGVRGNRLSQQLAIRQPGAAGKPGETWRDPDETAAYSVMAADAVEITQATQVMGEITTRGRLLDLEGQPLAKFVQRYRVCRGSRVLRLDIELTPTVEPQADPWNSYFACRFAWSDEAADLYRTVHQSRQPVGSRQFETSHYVQVASGEKSVTFLTDGLPFHRRVGLRMLDSLLIVRGERTRNFSFGIGIDLTHPLQDAMSLLAPTPTVFQTRSAPTPPNSWLFHIDAKNVIATHWEPLLETEHVVGVRVRLLESAGRAARAKLSAFRPFTSARQVDFRGQTLAECQVDEGQVRLDLAAHEWIELEARW